MSGPKKVWIDLSTAPDPLFFRPIVHRLHERGHSSWITARDYSETAAIAAQCGLRFEMVGRHGGASLSRKAWAIVSRARDLAELARRATPDVAVSFNSYAQGLAAKRDGIPFVTVMDYEHQPANHLAFRIADRVIVPEGFDRSVLRRQGAREHRVVVHPGLKEHVSLVDFTPDPDFPRQLEALGILPEDILVTMRPPATHSTYHRFENDLFDDAVVHLAAQPGVKVLVLPRYPSQAERLRSLASADVVVPPGVMDGLNLVYWSDLVVSAGGSMNREAVALATPACTIFQGRMGGVDRQLIDRGLLRHLRCRGDLEALAPVKRTARRGPPSTPGAIEDIIRTVLDSAS